MRKCMTILMIGVACLFTLVLTAGNAHAVSASSTLDGDELVITITRNNTNDAQVKDFHFSKGALPNGAVVTVSAVGPPPDNTPIVWAATVSNGNVNVYNGGGSSLPVGTSTFRISLPAGHKWKDHGGTLTLTNDGNEDASDGFVSDVGGAAGTVILADVIPTLSEWGAIIFGALLLASVIFYIIHRRRRLTIA